MSNNNYVIEQCPECEENYTLGINGTVEGCDECTETARDFFGQIIDEEDPLTDMEKA